MVVVHRKRRTTELVLLVLAIGLGVGAWLITHLNVNGELPDNWPYVVGLWVFLGAACHTVVRIRIPYADPVLLPCVFLLNGLGLAMIARLDMSDRATDAPAQLLWTILGVALFCALLFITKDHRPLDRFTYLFALAGLLLLLLPLVPGLGVELNGSRIWISVGPLSFQPAEAAKIILAISFASYLVAHREVLALASVRVVGIDLPRLRDFVPITLVWGVCMLVLAFQRDLGTALLFFGMFVMMLYVATERPGWAIVGLVFFASGAVAAWLLMSHVQVRVDAWLDPFANPDRSYQIIQGQYGIAFGGLLGRGLGLGRPMLTPIVKSDFISAAIAEELGIAGLMAVVMIYALVVSRGLKTALIGRDPFGKLLAAGLSFVFALQVFVIIGGVTRLLPLTGLTTPFMSQGGSSLVCNWVLIGLLMIISHQFRRPVAKAVETDPDAESTQLIPAVTGGRARDRIREALR
ncbi:FtsW/RodA/SpoVE family cell cycle protein [Microlunatus sp. Y2014]|uniref:FtsW/RodA/SpoVE family cell cycle protein n=1 Tax=Microlunatus sp. Y2014 TaxID=3418488 RepID=UPI003DA7273C